MTLTYHWLTYQLIHYSALGDWSLLQEYTDQEVTGTLYTVVHYLQRCPTRGAKLRALTNSLCAWFACVLLVIS